MNYFIYFNKELAASENKLIDDVEFINEKTATKSTDAGESIESPIKSKRRKLAIEPSSLSEEEQIELAIVNSMRETGMKKCESDSENDDELDEIDDDDDDDFGDDFNYGRTQTTAKEPEPSRTDCNATTESPESTSQNSETYETYLGDQNGKFYLLFFLFSITLFILFVCCCRSKGTNTITIT